MNTRTPLVTDWRYEFAVGNDLFWISEIKYIEVTNWDVTRAIKGHPYDFPVIIGNDPEVPNKRYWFYRGKCFLRIMVF
jgi:hypothetical protein